MPRIPLKPFCYSNRQTKMSCIRQRYLTDDKYSLIKNSDEITFEKLLNTSIFRVKLSLIHNHAITMNAFRGKIIRKIVYFSKWSYCPWFSGDIWSETSPKCFQRKFPLRSYLNQNEVIALDFQRLFIWDITKCFQRKFPP